MRRTHALGAALTLAACALCPPARALPPGPGPDPSDAALARGYGAYLAHDAQGAARALAELPKDHPLRPWAQGWAQLAEPSADPQALAASARRFAPSIMKWRLLSLSAQQSAKSGDIAGAQAALSAVPSSAQGPLQRCIGALGRAAAPEEAVELLSQGAGADACSKAASSIASNADALASAFARMPLEQARSAAAALGPAGAAASGKALAELARLAASPQWDAEFPLASKEALSRMVATALGKGACPKELPAAERLTDKGAANAARCALWTSGPEAAAPYWAHLSSSRPREPRWPALAWLAGGPGPMPQAPPTSYAGLALREAAGGSTPEAVQPAAAPSCGDAPVAIDLALWSHGLRREAIDSWREELSRAEPARRACMGLAADAIGAHPLRIAAFAADSFDPRAYAPGFGKALSDSAAARGIPVELWASLARQESRFDASAVSRSGALGMFQLMPGTARDAAAEEGLPAPSAGDLLSAQANSDLAAAHFSKLRAQFEGSPVWPLCAYNAGAARCRGWRAKLAKLPPVFQIEAMPYDETRVYVERILSGWTLTAPADPSRAAFLARGIRPAADAKPASKPRSRHGKSSGRAR